MSVTWTGLERALPAAVAVLVGCILWLLPGRTRPDLHFGYTVDPGFRGTAEARAALAVYRLGIVVGLLAALVLALAPSAAAGGFVATSGPPLAVLVVSGAAYLLARRRVRPHAVSPSPRREAAVRRPPTPLPGGVPGQAGPFALLAAAAWMGMRWVSPPPHVPLHLGSSGAPGSGPPGGSGTVLAPLASVAGSCALLLAIALGIARWSRRVNASGEPGLREERFRRWTLRILLAAEYLLAAMATLAVVAPAAGLAWPEVGRVLALVGAAGLVAAALWLLVAVGQGGQLGVRRRQDGGPVGDRTDDRFWLGGLIYVNPDDPAVFVEKRFGVGYTLNFGSPWAWALLTSLLLPALIAVALSRR